MFFWYKITANNCNKRNNCPKKVIDKHFFRATAAIVRVSHYLVNKMPVHRKRAV